MTPPNNLIQVEPGIFIDPTVRQQMKGRKFVYCDEDGLRELGLPLRRMSNRRFAAIETLERLNALGLIKLSRVTPARAYILDYATWEAHLQRTSEDPWYWSDRERSALWRKTRN